MYYRGQQYDRRWHLQHWLTDWRVKRCKRSPHAWKKAERAELPEACWNAQQELLQLQELKARSAMHHLSVLLSFPHPEPRGTGRCKAAGICCAWSLKVKADVGEPQINVLPVFPPAPPPHWLAELGYLLEQCRPIMVRGGEGWPLPCCHHQLNLTLWFCLPNRHEFLYSLRQQSLNTCPEAGHVLGW